MAIVDKVIAIADAHHENEVGNMYQVGHYDAAVANTASLEILIRTGSTLSLHSVFATNVGGDSVAYLFEAPTVTVVGTTITPINNNRNSANTAEGLFYHTPTTTADGTPLNNGTFIPGGSGGNAVGGSAGSSIRDGGEIILKPNTDYLVRITNISGAAKNISLTHLFYEEL
jgi:hypothetical protein